MTGCADELFDVEHRTAFRRFLGRAAVGRPRDLPAQVGGEPSRGGRLPGRSARANESTGPDAALETQELLAWFGVKGSISQRAEVFLWANGVNPH